MSYHFKPARRPEHIPTHIKLVSAQYIEK